MSRHNRPRPSQQGDPNAQITAPIAPPPVGTNAHIQEKQMETPQEKPQDRAQPPIELTAKQLAAVEEANAARVIAQQKADEQRAAAEKPPETIIGLAAQGREVLLDRLRAHAAKEKKPDYVPPPMTDRQKSALQEEMQAGARAVAKAQAQSHRASHPLLPQPNEPLTTPVHRPGEFVPGLNSKDPALK